MAGSFAPPRAAPPSALGLPLLRLQEAQRVSFAAQVRFPAEQVTIDGSSSEYALAGDNGVTRLHFCTTCGGAVFYRHDYAPEMIAIAMGALDDPFAFPPSFSVFEPRKHDWLQITGNVEHK